MIFFCVPGSEMYACCSLGRLSKWCTVWWGGSCTRWTQWRLPTNLRSFSSRKNTWLCSVCMASCSSRFSYTVKVTQCTYITEHLTFNDWISSLLVCQSYCSRIHELHCIWSYPIFKTVGVLYYCNSLKCGLLKSRGTVAATPPPFRPGNPALCGSHPLVTPYYCRLADLLCFVFIVCLLYFFC